MTSDDLGLAQVKLEYRCPKCGAQADERWDCCEVKASTLPSQVEPVGYADAADIVAMANVRRNGGSGMIRVTSSASGSSDAPLYTAEALAAERARADSEAGSRRSAYEYAEAWETEAVDLRKRLTAAEARADRAEEALKDCIDTLATVEREASVDPRYGDEVDRLGRRIGFGALMSSAQASWRKYLAETNGHAGGEFVAGPCFATVQGTLRRARTILKETPHDER